MTDQYQIDLNKISRTSPYGLSLDTYNYDFPQ